MKKKTEYEKKVQRQQAVLKQFSTGALIEKLNDAAHQAEHESDELAKNFLHGSVDLNTFVKEFMVKRKLYHLRAAKKESLSLLSR